MCDNLRVPVGGAGAAGHWATGDEAATRSCSPSAGVHVTSPTPQPLVVERIFPASRIVPSLRIPPPSPFSILGPENPLVRLLSSFRFTQQACTSQNSVARTPGRPEVPRPRPQSTREWVAGASRTPGRRNDPGAGVCATAPGSRLQAADAGGPEGPGSPGTCSPTASLGPSARLGRPGLGGPARGIRWLGSPEVPFSQLPQVRPEDSRLGGGN